MTNGHSDLQQTGISSDFKIPTIKLPVIIKRDYDLKYILKAV